MTKAEIDRALFKRIIEDCSEMFPGNAYVVPMRKESGEIYEIKVSKSVIAHYLYTQTRTQIKL